MKAYLFTVAVLFIAGALANLHNLSVASIPFPRRAVPDPVTGRARSVGRIPAAAGYRKTRATASSASARPSRRAIWHSTISSGLTCFVAVGTFKLEHANSPDS
ncbi:hypothetical protein [Paraburkholderia silvatlantica]|uniref:hypothetical protein n=1 Tax=Paraburkholderia silvatlantica TaxID=321895 RepID=UPI00105D669A|nr:hypothetical protein [Paraburkholderia silvatlantica]